MNINDLKRTQTLEAREALEAVTTRHARGYYKKRCAELQMRIEALERVADAARRFRVAQFDMFVGFMKGGDVIVDAEELTNALDAAGFLVIGTQSAPTRNDGPGGTLNHDPACGHEDCPHCKGGEG